jgi:ribosome-associated toxin RatA of RatAB toxin-antitoxin module
MRYDAHMIKSPLFAALLLAAAAQAQDVVKTVPVPGSDVPYYVVEAILHAPPEKVWDIAIHCGNYHKTMVRISEAKQLSGDDVSTQVCRTVADLPFPLPDLVSVTRATLNKGDTQWVRSWTLIEGDYEINEGGWIITPRPDGTTKATYKIRVKPKMMLPDGLMQSFTKKALPDMMANLRRQVETPAP